MESKALGSDTPSPSSPQMATDGAALTAAEILSRAADLIEPEGAWTRGHLALREMGGVGVNFDDPSAKCFCASGAILRAAGRGRPSLDAYILLERVIGGRGTPDWNDAPERTQAEVVAALRKASALASTQAGRTGE